MCGELYKELIEYFDNSLPFITITLRKRYWDGFKSRLENRKRMTHGARRKKIWFIGYDDADKKLKKVKNMDRYRKRKIKSIDDFLNEYSKIKAV